MLAKIDPLLGKHKYAIKLYVLIIIKLIFSPFHQSLICHSKMISQVNHKTTKVYEYWFIGFTYLITYINYVITKPRIWVL